MRSLESRRVVGAALIAGAVLLQVPYTILVTTFDYPDVLRAPTADILTRFHAAGAPLVLTWLAFVWTGLPLLFALPVLPRAIGVHESALAKSATVLGVAGLVVQMVGLLRWVFVVPVLARTFSQHTDEATRAAVSVAFELVHHYGGVALGEHLGMALTCLWMGSLSIELLRGQKLPRWLGVAGLVASAVYALAQLELLSLVVPGVPVWEPAGLVGSLLWLGWLIALGVALMRRERA